MVGDVLTHRNQVSFFCSQNQPIHCMELQQKFKPQNICLQRDDHLSDFSLIRMMFMALAAGKETCPSQHMWISKCLQNEQVQWQHPNSYGPIYLRGWTTPFQSISQNLTAIPATLGNCPEVDAGPKKTLKCTRTQPSSWLRDVWNYPTLGYEVK